MEEERLIQERRRPIQKEEKKITSLKVMKKLITIFYLKKAIICKSLPINTHIKVK